MTLSVKGDVRLLTSLQQASIFTYHQVCWPMWWNAGLLHEQSQSRS